MKLEVGMYARNEDGNIGKLCLDENNIKCIDTGKEKVFMGIFWNRCKSSFNIIDLIEKGDYVNGDKVYDIDVQNNLIKYKDGTWWNIPTIIDIETREQHDANKYVVGE